jgi:uncharacterized protein (DUF2147 family)
MAKSLHDFVRSIAEGTAVKRCGRGAATLCAAWSLATAAAAAPTPSEPTGDWMVEKGLAIIRVVNCSGQFWGVVVWEQSPGIDDKNPDASKRNRPTLGMPILLGMTPSEPNLWTGEIYNSEDGHTYSAKIKLASPDVLRVEGCVLGFLCGGQNWTRTSQEATTGSAEGTPRPAASARAATGGRTAPQADERTAQVCSGLVGGSRSTHERGLK